MFGGLMLALVSYAHNILSATIWTVYFYNNEIRGDWSFTKNSNIEMEADGSVCGCVKGQSLCYILLISDFLLLICVLACRRTPWKWLKSFLHFLYSLRLLESTPCSAFCPLWCHKGHWFAPYVVNQFQLHQQFTWVWTIHQCSSLSRKLILFWAVWAGSCFCRTL